MSHDASDGDQWGGEENDFLTQTGRGTAMGELFRQYWIPVVLPEDLAEKRQKRVRLLGEDLVVFRTALGNYGLVGEFCSHRRASLYLGRVEGEAIRCLYHGWLYGTDGQCLEQGNLPADRQFCDRIKHPGYRCVEHGGVVWAYMGTDDETPALPEFEWALVDPGLRATDKVLLECNYLQAMEGGIDPTHVMWLHSPIDLSDAESSSYQRAGQRLANQTGQRTPTEFEVQETPYGFQYEVKRTLPDGNNLWRVNQWLMPFYSMSPGDELRGARMWVPADDQHTVRWDIAWYPTREIMDRAGLGPPQPKGPAWVSGLLPETSEFYGDIRKIANKANDYKVDWDLHYSKRMGITGVPLQDIAMVENQGPGPIMDRSQENLCGADMTVALARRRLVEAATALKAGTPPVGVRDGSVYRVRGASVVLPADANMLEGIRESTTVAPALATER